MKNTLKFMAILWALYGAACPVYALAEDIGGHAPAMNNLSPAPTASVPDDTTAKKTPVTEDTAVSEDVPAKDDTSSHGNTSYKIIAGDILQITVWKEEGLDQEALVLPGGMINFPLVGSMNVQGQSPAEVQEEIKEKLHK